MIVVHPEPPVFKVVATPDPALPFALVNERPSSSPAVSHRSKNGSANASQSCSASPTGTNTPHQRGARTTVTDQEERDAIIAAMERLFAGTPLRSCGNLDIISLAEGSRTETKQADPQTHRPQRPLLRPNAEPEKE